MNRKMIILVILAVAVSFGFILAKFPLKLATIIGAISGWAAFIIRTLYNRWEWFYLTFQRIKYTLFSPDTLWNMTVRYEGNFKDDILKSVQNRIASSGRLDELKITSITTRIIEYRSQGIMFQIHHNGNNEIELHLMDLSVSYSKSLNILQITLMPLFDLIEIEIKPDRKSYFLTVNFEGAKNPYYGLYLNKIEYSRLVSFDIVFQVKDNQVEIHKDKMTIYSNTIGELLDISKDYLALAPK